MEERLIEERRKKLAKLKEAKLDPYPARAEQSCSIGEARARFAALARNARKKKRISLAGRVTGTRDQGSIMFWDLEDESGKIQAVLAKDTLKDFNLWKSTVERGDFVSVSGVLFTTKKREKSIEAHAVEVLAKSLRPLPSEWYGLEETEIRLRHRYLDLLMHPETKELFKKKSLFWESFREMLCREGFLEVETPVLESIPGGAEAEPFQTHHNALDTDFYLRISLELPLKKLLVGGFEKIFEVGRIFRNEGISKEHLQDYTQLEFYWAYHDYRDLMTLVERLYKTVIRNVFGKLVTVSGGTKIEWGKKWPTIDYVHAFKKASGLDPVLASREALLQKANALELSPEPHFGKGRLIDSIFKKVVRPTLVQPAFLVDPPVEVEPLAKRSPSDPRRVERFQVMAAGTELGKGFSELNDPVDQRKRFEEQMRLRAAGDKEAQRLDEDFIEALEYGMPPAAGFGVSERLFAVLVDKPVRETVFFPLMRPKK